MQKSESGHRHLSDLRHKIQPLQTQIGAELVALAHALGIETLSGHEAVAKIHQFWARFWY